jgi:hypothetical protein
MSRLRRYIPRRVIRTVRNLQQRAQVRAIRRAHAQAKTAAPAPLLPTALVIPVHNDAIRLARLLDTASAMGFAQIIVVDDGSDLPVVIGADRSDVTLIRHDTPRGPGAARTTGTAHVTAPYLIYLDSDDLPTAELPPLLADLARQPAFDVCLYKHIDSHIANSGHWGQPPADEAHWSAAGVAIGALQEAPRAVWPELAQIANYPWNKVYRTAFLREHDIRCADTPVHQDITLHWLTFLHAQRLLTSDRTCVWHMIADGANRLTNRTGPERLRVFEALAPIVAANPPPDMAVALTRFVLTLSDWIRSVLDPVHLPAFESALAHWLKDTIAGWHTQIEASDPALMAQIKTQIKTQITDHP